MEFDKNKPGKGVIGGWTWLSTEAGSKVGVLIFAVFVVVVVVLSQWVMVRDREEVSRTPGVPCAPASCARDTNCQIDSNWQLPM